MANFKVVFRSDNQGADTSPGWEPGCPLLVNAVQVSRNTDTGQCYLQLKLSNISGATVDSFKLPSRCELCRRRFRNRGAQPPRRRRPASQDASSRTGFTCWFANTNVIVRVLSVSQPEIEWHAEAGSEPRAPLWELSLCLTKKRPQNALNHWKNFTKTLPNTAMR